MFATINKIGTIILVFLFFASCIHSKEYNRIKAGDPAIVTLPDTLTIYDQARNRSIPIAVYRPLANKGKAHPWPVILSHGYGANKGGDYLVYSYLTTFLAEQGFFVVSVQHELPTDSLLPLSGDPQQVRRPFWERGADNILFVINYLKKTNSALDFSHLVLIGHSNGGDMTALFPQKYPGLAHKIITLDNRRMPLPGIRGGSVYSIRSSDQPADEGVLPTTEEQKKLNITIVQLNHTKHNEMDDDANNEQRQEIRKLILRFLSQ